MVSLVTNLPWNSTGQLSLGVKSQVIKKNSQILVALWEGALQETELLSKDPE